MSFEQISLEIPASQQIRVVRLFAAFQRISAILRTDLPNNEAYITTIVDPQPGDIEDEYQIHIWNTGEVRVRKFPANATPITLRLTTNAEILCIGGQPTVDEAIDILDFTHTLLTEEAPLQES